MAPGEHGARRTRERRGPARAPRSADHADSTVKRPPGAGGSAPQRGYRNGPQTKSGGARGRGGCWTARLTVAGRWQAGGGHVLWGGGREPCAPGGESIRHGAGWAWQLWGWQARARVSLRHLRRTGGGGAAARGRTRGTRSETGATQGLFRVWVVGGGTRGGCDAAYFWQRGNGPSAAQPSTRHQRDSSPTARGGLDVPGEVGVKPPRARRGNARPSGCADCEDIKGHQIGQRPRAKR